MLNKSLLKIICLCSLISGAIVGIVPLFPALTWIAILIIMFFSAPFIIIYLKKLNLLQDISTEQNLFIGAVSGFSSFIGFSIVYFPLAFLIYVIFKIQAFMWVKIVVTNFLFLFLTVILTAFMSALLNAFSAFLTEYFYQIFKQKK